MDIKQKKEMVTDSLENQKIPDYYLTAMNSHETLHNDWRGNIVQ